MIPRASKISVAVMAVTQKKNTPALCDCGNPRPVSTFKHPDLPSITYVKCKCGDRINGVQMLNQAKG